MPLFKLTYKRGKSLERSSMTVSCVGLLSAWEFGQRISRSLGLREIDVAPCDYNDAWHLPRAEQPAQGEL